MGKKQFLDVKLCVCECAHVHVCMHMYVFIYTHTHTHTHILCLQYHIHFPPYSTQCRLLFLKATVNGQMLEGNFNEST